MANNRSVTFLSSTLIGRQQNKRVLQLVQGLLDSPDSFQFRVPVDWKAYNLLDYPSIIKKPMDLSTVKNNINKNSYETVEECLADIYLIWENCRTYNKDNQYYIKLSEKLDKLTKKMIKNYLSFVVFENNAQADKKKGPNQTVAKKQTVIKKTTSQKIPQADQPKTYQDMKDNNKIQQEPKQEETPFIKMRKEFLMLIPLCTSEQVGVIFMLINKKEPEAIEYTEEGDPNIKADKMSDSLVKRLADQMDMWGVGYVPTKKR